MEKLKSRKLWITVVAMALPALMLVASTWMMITAPERAGHLTAVAGAVSAVLTTAAGAVYVVTEGKIDLRALPQALDPVLEAVIQLASTSAEFYGELADLAGRYSAGEGGEAEEPVVDQSG